MIEQPWLSSLGLRLPRRHEIANAFCRSQKHKLLCVAHSTSRQVAIQLSTCAGHCRMYLNGADAPRRAHQAGWAHQVCEGLYDYAFAPSTQAIQAKDLSDVCNCQQPIAILKAADQAMGYVFIQVTKLRPGSSITAMSYTHETLSPRRRPALSVVISQRNCSGKHRARLLHYHLAPKVATIACAV